ncbi:uncharacterized protein LOC123290875 [Chrysoperla carnea]|uniref:uncharacterized protein LOC123290875 n=1 Tax=Chrysoperla carnea TaxID=189513 RepID=UPI001D083AFB|nr:uncharacterized protein LOC123290875 [Chrysoperla carnea]
MDCCNYMDYQLQSIYNYNRTQYNDTGAYHSSNGYHNQVPPTYCSYNSFGSNSNGYHYPSTGPNHVQNHHAANFNEYSQRSYYNDRTNSNYLHYDGGPIRGGHAPPPPPPPPLPPSSGGPHLFGASASSSSSSSSNGTTAGATDYQYNPKEARIRKAQRDALKVAQRQAASAVPLLQSPGYSPLSNTSRLDMNSTSPMQQFIPAYTSQQTLGQNVGSISGGGIINTGPSPLGSRSPAIVLSNTTSRRPPPPAYPGLARQQSFHHGLEPNHREYGMGYGEPNFNPLPNIYSNNQNISSPSESHTSGMFDSHYQNSTPMESGLWNGMSQSTNMWNSQNFDLQRQHSLNDYSPFQSPAEQHSRNQLIPATSTPTPGTNLDDPSMFNHSDFPADAYNYQKNQHPLNILTPKDLNRSIKTENHIDNSIVPTKEDLSTSQRIIEQYPPRTNTPMPSLPYNPNLYKHETISHVASSYHPKMSPKLHSDETRMSPYNRPNHSPKNGSKDLIHYRISPKIFDNKMSSSPKSQKSPKSHKHGNTSPSAFKFDSSRKSPKAQNIVNGGGHTQEVKREPSPEKHPLPAFSKAFSGTERGRLLATPENTNLNLVGATSDTSDSLTFPSKITAETQKKVLDLVVANDYLNIPKWNANSIVNFGVPPNYGLFTHGLVPPILYDLNCMNLYEAGPNNNNKNKSPKLQACFGPQHEIFTTSDVAVKYYSGMFQHMNSTINATPQVPLMGVSNINTVLQNKEQTDPKMVSTTVISSTDDIIDIAADDDYVISTTTC